MDKQILGVGCMVFKNFFPQELSKEGLWGCECGGGGRICLYLTLPLFGRLEFGVPFLDVRFIFGCPGFERLGPLLGSFGFIFGRSKLGCPKTLF